MRDIAEDLGGRLERYPRIRDVNTNASWGYFDRERASEFAVDIRRDVVAQHDVSVEQLVEQISAAVRGQVSQNQIKIAGDEVRYDVKLEGNRDVDLVELRKVLVLTPAGAPFVWANWSPSGRAMSWPRSAVRTSSTSVRWRTSSAAPTSWATSITTR